MQRLSIAGKKHSKEYEDLRGKAVEYQQSIKQLNEEIKTGLTGNISGVIQMMSLISGGMSVAQGAVSLFSGENENLHRIMVKLQSLTAITIGLQEIHRTTNDKKCR